MSERSRLRWRCRRGMLELDLLLERFLEQGYDALDERGRSAFDRLLDEQDDQLFDWFCQGQVPEDPEIAGIVARIRGTDPNSS